jgi:hypothetical protein
MVLLIEWPMCLKVKDYACSMIYEYRLEKINFIWYMFHIIFQEGVFQGILDDINDVAPIEVLYFID